jgi:putative transposase
MVACDFFTVETVWPKRIDVLVFIELGTRRVHLAGCNTNPGDWVTQQARNFTLDLDQRAQPLPFLIHDRDAKFCGPFRRGARNRGTPSGPHPHQGASCERHL